MLGNQNCKVGVKSSVLHGFGSVHRSILVTLILLSSFCLDASFRILLKASSSGRRCHRIFVSGVRDDVVLLCHRLDRGVLPRDASRHADEHDALVQRRRAPAEVTHGLRVRRLRMHDVLLGRVHRASRVRAEQDALLLQRHECHRHLGATAALRASTCQPRSLVVSSSIITSSHIMLINLSCEKHNAFPANEYSTTFSCVSVSYTIWSADASTSISKTVMRLANRRMGANDSPLTTRSNCRQ